MQGITSLCGRLCGMPRFVGCSPGRRGIRRCSFCFDERFACELALLTRLDGWCLGTQPCQRVFGVTIRRQAKAATKDTCRELSSLTDHLAPRGIPTAGQATIHLIWRAALDGLISHSERPAQQAKERQQRQERRGGIEIK